MCYPILYDYCDRTVVDGRGDIVGERGENKKRKMMEEKGGVRAVCLNYWLETIPLSAM